MTGYKAVFGQESLETIRKQGPEMATMVLCKGGFPELVLGIKVISKNCPGFPRIVLVSLEITGRLTVLCV